VSPKKIVIVDDEDNVVASLRLVLEGAGYKVAACRTAAGTSKSGWPIDRLMGFSSLAARSNTLRMPEASMLSRRSAMR